MDEKSLELRWRYRRKAIAFFCKDTLSSNKIGSLFKVVIHLDYDKIILS